MVEKAWQQKREASGHLCPQETENIQEAWLGFKISRHHPSDPMLHPGSTSRTWEMVHIQTATEMGFNVALC